MNEQQFQKVKILLDIGMNNQTQLDLDRVLKNYIQYRYEDPLKIHPTSYHPKLLSNKLLAGNHAFQPVFRFTCSKTFGDFL